MIVAASTGKLAGSGTAEWKLGPAPNAEDQMKKIRNPTIWWKRLAKLQHEYAKAVKQHKKRKDLEAMMRMIRTAIIAYELRHEG